MKNSKLSSLDKNGKIEKTSEQAFHVRRVEEKKTTNVKTLDVDVSWQKRAEEFLDSDTVGSQATKVALALFVVAGALAILPVSPGLGIIARNFRRLRYFSKKQLQDAEQNLKRRHYIEMDSIGGKPRIRLTKKGEEYFQKMIFEESRLSSQEKWDEKWRFVLFDIPIGYTKAREALRWKLRTLGFYQYQKSVWVYPYPCKDEILFVAEHFGIGKFIEIIEVTGITEDAGLKKHFGLP